MTLPLAAAENFAAAVGAAHRVPSVAVVVPGSFDAAVLERTLPLGALVAGVTDDEMGAPDAAVATIVLGVLGDAHVVVVAAAAGPHAAASPAAVAVQPTLAAAAVAHAAASALTASIVAGVHTASRVRPALMIPANAAAGAAAVDARLAYCRLGFWVLQAVA